MQRACRGRLMAALFIYRAALRRTGSLIMTKTMAKKRDARDNAPSGEEHAASL
jgi:hypothetical protein